ncbi:hypothetical protein PRIPAC_95947, partial [Pristionchus pacificus]|uniref:G_PROTEIN_RECEP_F1_2 domain-containing protein n=1 Tax=Pristionchus pacificus TaxID=54126 RepID=A0A2A6BDC5_PRIPA
NPECFYGTPTMPVFRFWMVTVGGTNISLVSVIENIFLIYLFSRPAHRQGQNLYMLLIAIFDLFVSFAYILLMSLNVLSDYLYYLDYFQLAPRLLRFWFSYAAPLMTLSHIAMSSSSFLIIAASVERYFLATKSPKLIFVQNYRGMIALASILLGVGSKFSVYYELDIQHHTNCTGQMLEFQMDYSSFVHGTLYNSIVRFWFRTIITFVVTLLILIYLNFRIFIAQTNTDASRSAKYSFIAIVCCNIASNVCNVILGVGENFAKDTLIQNHLTIYAVTVDVASLAITFICSLRLPIYLLCQTPLSEEILGIFRSWFKCNKDRVSPQDKDGENGISDTTNDTLTK